MRIGRFWVGRPHRARHWYDGVCFEYALRPRPGEEPWQPRRRYLRIYVQW